MAVLSELALSPSSPYNWNPRVHAFYRYTESKVVKFNLILRLVLSTLHENVINFKSIIVNIGLNEFTSDLLTSKTRELKRYGRSESWTLMICARKLEI